MDKSIERKVIEITMKYYEDDICLLYRYQQFFVKYSPDNGYRLPPARIYDAFISLLTKTQIDKSDFVKTQKKTFIEQTLSFFYQIRKYDFESQTVYYKEGHTDDDYTPQSPTIGGCINSSERFSFAKMITLIYDQIFYSEISTEKKDKKLFVITVYGWIDEYISYVFPNDDDYSHYRKAVITGFIASRFRLYPNQDECGELDYTSFIYGKVKDFTKNYNK